MRIVLSLLVLLLPAVSGHAGETAAEKHAKVIAPFVDEQTFIVGHIDVSKIDVEVLAKHLQMFGAQAADLEKGKAVATLAKTTFLKSGGNDIYVLMNWVNPMGEILLVAQLAKDAEGPALAALASQIPGYQAEIKNNVLLAGSKKSMARLKDFKAKAVPTFAKAFAEIGEGSAQIVFLPPFALKRAILEMHPTLPKEIGGGQMVSLDFNWAAARINASDALDAKVLVQAPDAKAAQEISKIVGRAMDFGVKTKEVITTFPDLPKIIPLITPKVQENRLSITLNDKDLSTVLVPLIVKQREAAARTTSVNNLKQLALAMHNFHDRFGSFPASATYDAKGQPLLSWRVHILQYIEQDELYKQFHLNEPWDSEHNKKLIAKMPATYRSPLQKNPEEGKTTYLVPVGAKTIFEGKKGMPIQKITDGTSNTIMIVEANDDRAVFWTQPEDFKIDPQNPLAGLIRPGARGFNAAFADGSVRFMMGNINPATLKAMFTASGDD